MSAGSDSQRFSKYDWDDINEELAEEKRRQIGSSDRDTGENLQHHNMIGVEEEHPVEKPTSADAIPVHSDFSLEHLQRLAEIEQAINTERVDTHEDNIVKLVELEFDEYKGASEYDVGPEKEDVTGIVNTVDDALKNLNQVEQTTLDSAPRDDVQFRRQGMLTRMMTGNFYDTVGREHFFQEPKYEMFGNTYDVEPVAGTGSIQVTMRPKIYDEEHDQEVDVDKWLSEFKGGQDEIGMSALSPLFYGPFMSSPVMYNHEGKTVIETLNGRDKAYDESFLTLWDRQGQNNKEEPGDYITKNSKAGFSPALANIESIEEDQDFSASSEWNFAQVEASKVKVVDDEDYDQDEDYDVLSDRVEFIDEDDNALIRVGKENWDLEDKDSIMPFKEFIEREMFGGEVIVFDEEGNSTEYTGVVDYRDEEIFPDMDDEAFKEEGKKQFKADTTAVWEPWRERPADMALEYRDVGNNPFRNEAIATQIGAFRRWREIQEFASENLGISNSHAKDLRLGVNGVYADHENDENYLENNGLQYTINEEENITVQDAWLGTNMEEGLIDILADGVDEMSTGELYSGEQYRSEMTKLIENGVTPGEMMAKEHGVDYIEGDVLYEPEDLIVGGQKQTVR
ncbi:MAG: hypothetical protein ACI977_000539 [Candidatus Nanohaloarchaea archaeon]|jgi:hypothetical protein